MVNPPHVSEFPRSEVEPAELEVLSSAHEDDYALWDIVAGVNAAVPRLHVAHALRLTQAVVLDILERGLLELAHGRAVHGEPYDAVLADDRVAVIGDLAAWDPFARVDGDPYYSVTATPAGIEEYYRLGHAAAEEHEDV